MSWLGTPENLVKQSLLGIKDFATSFIDDGTIIGGLKKGSLSLVRGISVGALVSIVSFSSSLERSIAQISPLNRATTAAVNAGDNENNEFAKRIAALVEFPIRGFQNNGILGVVTGTGKTIVGLITGPTTAFFSLINKAGVAILNQVGSDDKQGSDRRIEKEPKELPSIVFE